MKFFAIAATAIALAASPAAAGGWGGSHSVTSPQFANASALNLAVQTGSIKAIISKGNLKQTTGAAAEAINKADCGCKGKQVANAHSKNVSFQVGTITSGLSVGSINQSAVSTSLAKNVR